MRKTLLAALLAGFVSGPGLAVGQEPSKSPGPQLPATPSLDQKDSGDLSKPAGGSKPVDATPYRKGGKGGKGTKGGKTGVSKPSHAPRHGKMPKAHTSKHRVSHAHATKRQAPKTHPSHKAK